MPILQLIIILIVIGVLLYIANKYIPMQPTIKTVLNWVVVAFVAVWLLKELGVWDYLMSVHV
jgi:hypothetical protein